MEQTAPGTGKPHLQNRAENSALSMLDPKKYSPPHTALTCRFYHWGGLAGFISLLEAGFY